MSIPYKQELNHLGAHILRNFSTYSHILSVISSSRSQVYSLEREIRVLWTSLMVQRVKNPLQCRRHRFYPWVRKILCRKKWQPTPVFLPGKSLGQRSLAGYSPWGCKESDMTECLKTRVLASVSRKYDSSFLLSLPQVKGGWQHRIRNKKGTPDHFHCSICKGLRSD